MDLKSLLGAAGNKAKSMIANFAKKIGKKIAIAIFTNPYSYIVMAILLIIIIIAGVMMEDANAEEEERENMLSATNSTTSFQQFLKYVVSKEGGTKVDENGNASANGTYYIVEDDTYGNPTVGHGLCLYSVKENSYLHTDEFAAEPYFINTIELVEQYNQAVANGYDSKKSEHYKYFPKVEVSICDEIFTNHIKSQVKSVQSSCSSLNLKEYQIYALADVKYRRGNISGFTEQYNKLWSEKDDSYGKDVSSEPYSLDSLYSFFNNGWTDTTSGVYPRKQEQWLLFKYGYYKPLNEYWKDYGNSEISSDATVGEKGYRHPAPGAGITITNTHGSGHNGYDFAGDIDTPIYAATDGNITYYQYFKKINGVETLTSYGNCAYQVASDGNIIYYAHLNKFVDGIDLKIESSKTMQQKGNDGKHAICTITVKAGQLIGYMGTTGNSTGSHLHFEMRDKDGKQINPYDYIPEPH